MKFEEFKNACFKIALENGCENAEVYCAEGNAFSVDALNGNIDKYMVDKNFGLNLRVIYKGKSGYAYTECMENPEELVAHAIDNASVIENNDVNPMQGKCEYPVIKEKSNSVIDMSEKEKIDLALNMEKAVLAYDKRVNRVEGSEVGTGTSTVHIHNTLGLCADKKSSFSIGVIAPILVQDGDSQMSVSYKSGEDMVNYDDIIKESVEDALMQFNANPVPSGEYKVLLKNEAAGDLLAAFCGMFSADSVQKGLSLLKGKLGETIASPAVTLVDDPFEEDNPRAFDAEGVPSVKTTLIEKGQLKSFLHNLKTALKDNTVSTSNAGRPGISAPVSVAPSNFYIIKGEKNFDELTAELQNGLIITEISGLHAGLNAVSGDFSLIAKGQLVENGKIVHSVNQITCAGNFLSLMKGIIAVGSDMKFSLPGGSRVGCPSLLIDKLIISGK